MKLYKKARLNHEGFSHVELLLILVVIVVVAAVGVFVYRRDQNTSTVHAGAWSSFPVQTKYAGRFTFYACKEKIGSTATATTTQDTISSGTVIHKYNVSTYEVQTDADTNVKPGSYGILPTVHLLDAVSGVNLPGVTRYPAAQSTSYHTNGDSFYFKAMFESTEFNVSGGQSVLTNTMRFYVTDGSVVSKSDYAKYHETEYSSPFGLLSLNNC